MTTPQTLEITLQPIETAPTNDDVVLTEEGFARYANQRNWGSPVTNGWYACSPDGDILSCADDGMYISSISPKGWAPVPEFILPKVAKK